MEKLEYPLQDLIIGKIKEYDGGTDSYDYHTGNVWTSRGYSIFLASEDFYYDVINDKKYIKYARDYIMKEGDIVIDLIANAYQYLSVNKIVEKPFYSKAEVESLFDYIYNYASKFSKFSKLSPQTLNSFYYDLDSIHVGKLYKWDSGCFGTLEQSEYKYRLSDIMLLIDKNKVWQDVISRTCYNKEVIEILGNLRSYLTEQQRIEYQRISRERLQDIAGGHNISMLIKQKNTRK